MLAQGQDRFLKELSGEQSKRLYKFLRRVKELGLGMLGKVQHGHTSVDVVCYS